SARERGDTYEGNPVAGRGDGPGIDDATREDRPTADEDSASGCGDGAGIGVDDAAGELRDALDPNSCPRARYRPAVENSADEGGNAADADTRRTAADRAGVGDAAYERPVAPFARLATPTDRDRVGWCRDGSHIEDAARKAREVGDEDAVAGGSDVAGIHDAVCDE